MPKANRWDPAPDGFQIFYFFFSFPVPYPLAAELGAVPGRAPAQPGGRRRFACASIRSRR